MGCGASTGAPVVVEPVRGLHDLDVTQPEKDRRPESREAVLSIGKRGVDTVSPLVLQDGAKTLIENLSANERCVLLPACGRPVRRILRVWWCAREESAVGWRGPARHRLQAWRSFILTTANGFLCSSCPTPDTTPHDQDHEICTAQEGPRTSCRPVYKSVGGYGTYVAAQAHSPMDVLRASTILRPGNGAQATREALWSPPKEGLRCSKSVEPGSRTPIALRSVTHPSLLPSAFPDLQGSILSPISPPRHGSSPAPGPGVRESPGQVSSSAAVAPAAEACSVEQGAGS